MLGSDSCHGNENAKVPQGGGDQRCGGGAAGPFQRCARPDSGSAASADRQRRLARRGACAREEAAPREDSHAAGALQGQRLRDAGRHPGRLRTPADASLARDTQDDP